MISLEKLGLFLKALPKKGKKAKGGKKSKQRMNIMFIVASFNGALVNLHAHLTDSSMRPN